MNDGPWIGPDLKFPEGEKFRSMPPEASIEEVIRRSSQLRRWFPGGVPSAEERWKAKRTEEFQL
jgi:hypothetical protein